MLQPYTGSGDTILDPNDPKVSTWIRDACAQVSAPKKRNAVCAELVKSIARLEAQIAPLAADLAEARRAHKEACKHPVAFLRYVCTYREDEYGKTLRSPDYVWCVDCGQKIGETEPR